MTNILQKANILNAKQKEALPWAIWLFDPHAYHGEGRTTLLAYTAIKLAMDGNELELKNPSFIKSETGHRNNLEFARAVLRLCEECFSGHLFYFNVHTLVFRYVGPR